MGEKIPEIEIMGVKCGDRKWESLQMSNHRENIENF